MASARLRDRDVIRVVELLAAALLRGAVHGVGAPLFVRGLGVEGDEGEALAVVGDEHLLLDEPVDLRRALVELGGQGEVLLGHVVTQAGAEHGHELGHAVMVARRPFIPRSFPARHRGGDRFYSSGQGS